ncbi:MAG: hypothetical protein FWC34_00685 [Bacteroidetes bacterium]|nr:hypothetical protein [Bacteroidota bacterium]MCL2303695.1 hypothetical protein [Lentimicrobiaceae bacterium]
MIKKMRFSMMNVKMFLVAIALMPGLSATVFAQDVDVYIGGQDNSRAVVWKNGTPTYLTTGLGGIATKPKPSRITSRMKALTNWMPS